MKVIKTIFNILGILAATVLSLLLVVMLLATPLVSTASSFLKSDTLHKVVKSIDFASIFTASGISDQTQIKAEIINELMETEFVGDIISLYVDTLFTSLEENNTQVAVTAEDITTLADKHFDELLPIVKAQIGTDLPLPDEEIQKYAQQYITTLAPDVAAMLPSLDDLGVDETVITVLHNLYSGKVLKTLLLAISILSFLVLLCRFPRFKGFMWLGITYLCSSLLLFLFAFAVKTTGISLFTDLLPISKVIVSPLFSSLTSGIFKGAGIVFGLAAVFIIIFILGRKLLCKKEPAQQMAA